MKDFEDTDREGTAMDSRKPLTAGEIEEMKQLCADYANPACGVVDADVWKAFQALPRLLSMLEATDTALVMDDGGSVQPLLPPPPDAAVREAVESLQRMVDMDTFVEATAVKMQALMSYVRAVQAPRLELSSEDREDKYTEAINAAHPLKTKRHDLYELAMEMVGNRHSKAALVNLVNWLLSERQAPRRGE